MSNYTSADEDDVHVMPTEPADVYPDVMTQWALVDVRDKTSKVFHRIIIIDIN